MGGLHGLGLVLSLLLLRRAPLRALPPLLRPLHLPLVLLPLLLIGLQLLAQQLMPLAEGESWPHPLRPHAYVHACTHAPPALAPHSALGVGQVWGRAVPVSNTRGTQVDTH